MLISALSLLGAPNPISASILISEPVLLSAPILIIVLEYRYVSTEVHFPLTAYELTVRLSEAKRRVEAKYIFKVIQFNC